MQISRVGISQFMHLDLPNGDKAVFCTLDGPIVTEIRGLLTPPPSREMRVKSEYIHHKEIKGARGVKVIGNGLEKVMAGTPVMVSHCPYEFGGARLLATCFLPVKCPPFR